MNKLYSALIIDLVKSKAYETKDRIKLQQTISLVLDELNRVFQKSIIKKVEFSGGDEVQGLFSSPQAAFHYYRFFSMQLYPVKLRAGIGVGTWDVQLANKGTTGQDGTAYHHARVAIEKADEAEGILLYSGRAVDKLLNATINAAALLCREHSDHQNAYYQLAEVVVPLAAYSYLDTYALTCRASNLFKLKEGYNQFVTKQIQTFLVTPAQIGYYQNDLLKQRFDNTESFFVTSGKQRCLSLAMSLITGASRQNVDNIIKAGNIYTIRNLSIAAAKAMEQFCTEEEG